MAAKENEKMTIEQVAEALGVSKTTVSRALSGKGRISEKTRAKVFAYMGHARTEAAQKDPKVRTNNIAMVVPRRFITLDLPFLRKCMGGICTMADQRGYDMLLCYASSTEYTQLQRQLASHKVDGVILTYAMADDPCVDLLRQYDVPFVLIGRSEDKTIPQADNDQVTAACEMTRILLQMGAKRIALLVGSTSYAVNTDRTRGTCAALRNPACRWISALFIPALNQQGRPLMRWRRRLNKRQIACSAGTMRSPMRSCESCATGIFWCRTICALPACTTARCWPVSRPRCPQCSTMPSSWGARPAACCLTACLARKWCSAKLRGIRLFCVSPPNGIAVPTMDDSLRPSMAYPQIVQQGRYAALQAS